LPDDIFSPARLRAYRVLDEEGLGSAASFQILNAIASARLWIPLSLIEIAFRNAVDKVVQAAHPAGEAWLCDARGDDINWGTVSGRPIFQRRRPDEDLSVGEAAESGAPELDEESSRVVVDVEDDEDDSAPDPVALAARMAARHGRSIVTRDDVVAHLMFGFWTFRGPAGLRNEEPPIDVYALLTEHFQGRLGTPRTLEDLMVSEILMIRNRVAHHEPVLIRWLHIFDKKTGEARRGNDLVTSLQGAVTKYERRVDTVIDTAKEMVAIAADELEQLAAQIAADIKPLKERLATKLEENKAAKEARKAERQAAWERRAGSEFE
jgi:hypothetical protein